MLFDSLNNRAAGTDVIGATATVHTNINFPVYIIRRFVYDILLFHVSIYRRLKFY